jgi:hypothetical protein
MHPIPPPTVRCKECGAIVRQLIAAHQADCRDVRRRVEHVAAASGRDVTDVAVRWVFSVAQMPEQEMQALLDSHSPRMTAAKRKQREHEALTGHSVPVHGWWFFWTDPLRDIGGAEHE